MSDTRKAGSIEGGVRVDKDANGENNAGEELRSSSSVSSRNNKSNKNKQGGSKLSPEQARKRLAKYQGAWLNKAEVQKQNRRHTMEKSVIQRYLDGCNKEQKQAIKEAVAALVEQGMTPVQGLHFVLMRTLESAEKNSKTNSNNSTENH